MLVRYGGYGGRTVQVVGTLKNGSKLYKMTYTTDNKISAPEWKLVVVDEVNEYGTVFVRGASTTEILSAYIPDEGVSLPMKYAPRAIRHAEKPAWEPVRALIEARIARRLAARKK